MFRNIKGQDHTIDLLRKAIENRRISQAYLFHGSDGVGKFMTALYFGMAVNCYATSELKPCGVCASCHKFLMLEHPDLIYIFPTPNLELSTDGEIKKTDMLKQYQAYIQNKINTPWQDYFFKESTEIRKESITLLIKRLELSIHEANYRIVIIENADQLNLATANAFLKTLEEPPDNTVIMLITERLPMILPTILSRTQPVYFKPLSRGVVEEILTTKFEIANAIARTAARISAGNLKTAIRIASDSNSVSRDWAFELFRQAAKGDDLAFIALLEKNKELLNKDQLGDLLKYMRIIAGDLALLTISQTIEITNVDKLEMLAQISSSSPNLDDKLHDYLLFLEDLNRKLKGNVNQNLIMINLFINTKSFIAV
ncbi:MAG: DNA polymerase III subunit delta' [Candidatus Cloacimonas sp.]|jgi:DNA polymerase-3 subunit delta'|nr:DNA polymerase III subunit delta' [Candidatus Cloacimonas sp.]